MTAPISTSTHLALLLLAAACSPRVQASAQADAGLAHADGDDDGHRYDSGKLTRSGVQLDPELARSCKIDDQQAFFAFDSAEISDDAHAALAKVAACVTDGPLRGRELELVGHADPRGTDAYNKELGLSRAESVAACLREHGVTPSNIEMGADLLRRAEVA